MDSWYSVVTLDNGDRTELSSDSSAYGILQLILLQIHLILDVGLNVDNLGSQSLL